MQCAGFPIKFFCFNPTNVANQLERKIDIVKRCIKRQSHHKKASSESQITIWRVTVTRFFRGTLSILLISQRTQIAKHAKPEMKDIPKTRAYSCFLSRVSFKREKEGKQIEKLHRAIFNCNLWAQKGFQQCKKPNEQWNWKKSKRENRTKPREKILPALSTGHIHRDDLGNELKKGLSMKNDTSFVITTKSFAWD